jgi:hypothetical protein
VAYVTDYITKQTLKTYSIFDVVRSIFDKNSEMIGGDLKRKEKVRKIFTQVVNSLTAKMEIGGPMASLYVLGNPDHYTGHKFVTFYWRSYVKEVLSAWSKEQGPKSDVKDEPDKVVINKSEGKFVGLSKVNDYVFRPKMYEEVSLYCMIGFACMKSQLEGGQNQKKIGGAFHDPEFDESDNELNLKPTKTTSGPKNIKIEKASAEEQWMGDFIEDDTGCSEDEQKDEDEDELDVMDEPSETVSKEDRSFQAGHPQSRTHQARMKHENPLIVPNFLPNTLPRADRGDCEYYCCTMLTLFKPWRSGKDLKGKMDTWDKSFTKHEFSKRQMEVMKYFNVRYECLDARDDYSAKRDKEDDDKIKYQWATAETLDALDDTHYAEAYSGADFDVEKQLGGVGHCFAWQGYSSFYESHCRSCVQ